MNEQAITWIVLAGAAAVLGWVLYGALAPAGGLHAIASGDSTYRIVYVLASAVLLTTSAHVHNLRKKIDEMHGMMAGMTLGMTAGLLTATLLLIPTGNFLYGLIAGSVAGLLFGVPFGRLGGHLGVMEGVVAGPMGGMMGAMLGQMIRPFSIAVFMPFFVSVFLITLLGLCYAMSRCAFCRTPGQGSRNNPVFSGKLTAPWAAGAAALLAASVLLPFHVGATNATQGGIQLPPALQELAKEERMEAVQKGGWQETEVNIAAASYSPNVIVAKKGIPLKIIVHADADAGCTREILFPDFNIDRIVPAGGTDTIEINPEKEGTYGFRCSMDMAHGKLIVVK